MSQKDLRVDEITNELEGASLYFQPAHQVPARGVIRTLKPKSFSSETKGYDLKEQKRGDTLSTQSSMLASMHESKQDDLIETIRKTVKQVGKEELFVRLTIAEKKDLREIVYQLNEMYPGKGRKTSDNEVSRIALKSLLEDYRKNGENSILAITQAVLNA